jgi:hypothetical protein
MKRPGQSFLTTRRPTVGCQCASLPPSTVWQIAVKLALRRLPVSEDRSVAISTRALIRLKSSTAPQRVHIISRTPRDYFPAAPLGC